MLLIESVTVRIQFSDSLMVIEAQSAGGYYIPKTFQTTASTRNAKFAELQLMHMQTT